MDWLGEHLFQVVIAVAAAIAAFINNRRKEREGKDADYDGDGVPDNRAGQYRTKDAAADEAERTRRIQEEIRRKIAERRGDSRSVPPLVAPRPVARPIPEVIQRRFETMSMPPPIPAQREDSAWTETGDEVLERQRDLAEQVRALEARRAEARRSAAEVTAYSPTGISDNRVTSGAKPGGRELLADLRRPGGARRAWILREVLGPPPGLR
jgi:hypothetical protein